MLDEVSVSVTAFEMNFFNCFLVKSFVCQGKVISPRHIHHFADRTVSFFAFNDIDSSRGLMHCDLSWDLKRPLLQRDLRLKL